jgi:hypothetical protein
LTGDIELKTPQTKGGPGKYFEHILSLLIIRWHAAFLFPVSRLLFCSPKIGSISQPESERKQNTQPISRLAAGDGKKDQRRGALGSLAVCVCSAV